MIIIKHSFISFFLILLALNVQASTDNSGEQQSQEISFRVESSMLVDNDEMKAQLAVEDEGKDPSALAREVNKIMADALKMLKREPSIKAETGTYSTYPIHNKNRIVSWRVSQQLRLHSTDFEAMNKIIGKLQETLNVKSITFGISKDTQENAEEKLTQSVIEKFRKRAELISTSLKATGYKIKRLDINSQPGHSPRPLMRTMTMEADIAPVATAGGESNVSVHLNAVIVIH